MARRIEQAAASCSGSIDSEAMFCETWRNSAAVRAGLPLSSKPNTIRTTSARSSPEAGPELGDLSRIIACSSFSSCSRRAI